jgi:hypothetical protein
MNEFQERRKFANLEEVLCTVSGDDIPEHLKVRFDSEKKRDLEKRQEKEEASNYCEITVY